MPYEYHPIDLFDGIPFAKYDWRSQPFAGRQVADPYAQATNMNAIESSPFGGPAGIITPPDEEMVRQLIRQYCEQQSFYHPMAHSIGWDG
jgi:hypothetical protein